MRGPHLAQRAVKIVGLAVLCALFFVAGIVAEHEVGVAIRRPLNELLGREYRYAAVAEKREVICPKQTERTLVLVAFGQSNAANHLGQRYRGDPHVVNFFEGKCYAAADPLLGSTGRWGSLWTALGNRLVRETDAVVLITLGIEGSSVRKWRKSQFLSNALKQSPYRVTHFLWMQGEADRYMTAQDYASALRDVIATARALAPDAPFWVARSSLCDSASSPEIRRAQTMVLDSAQHIYAGPDTDALDALEDRYDGCHYSMVGQEKAVDLWYAAIKSATSRQK